MLSKAHPVTMQLCASLHNSAIPIRYHTFENEGIFHLFIIYLLQFNDQNQVQDKTMNTWYIEKNEQAQS